MISHQLRNLAWAVPVVFALACGDATAAPKTSTTSIPPVVSKPTPTAVRLVVAPDTTIVALGAQFSFAAYKVLSDSSRLPVSAFWSSNDEQVITVNPFNGSAAAVGPGHAMITARTSDFVAVATIAVAAPTNPGASDALVVDSFSMLGYPSGLTTWSYAPQMRAHAMPGHAASILVLKFSIPGLGNIPAFGCGASLSVTPRDLFGEVYGDWLLEIGGAQRATGDSATATITFVDNGTTAIRVVSGPIVQGGAPTSYTGGQNGGACFHGYGSTG
jgi:hypothetical protein